MRQWFAIEKEKIPISGIGATIYANGYVDVSLTHRHADAAIVTARMLIVRKISPCIPDQHIDDPFASAIPVNEYADPSYASPASIDALLGVGIWSEIIADRIRRVVSSDGMFVAQSTVLGWVITGQFTKSQLRPSNRCMMTIDDVQLDASLRKLWEIERIPVERPWTEEEHRAEQIFVQTHQRDDDGRYVVRIPRKVNPPVLGNSRRVAHACFRSLERKFSKDLDLYRKYRDIIDEYRATGHLQVATVEPDSESDMYVIPHHAINKSGEAKFRVVLNASAPSASGFSANDVQIAGPKLQADLCELFLRFRLGSATHCVA